MTDRMLGKLPHCAKVCYYIWLHLQCPTKPHISSWFLLLSFYILSQVSQGLWGKLAWMPRSTAQFTFWTIRFPVSVPVSLETSYKGSEAVFRIRRNRLHLVQNKLSRHRVMQVSSSEMVNGGGGGGGRGRDKVWSENLRLEEETWWGEVFKGLTGGALGLKEH